MKTLSPLNLGTPTPVLVPIGSSEAVVQIPLANFSDQLNVINNSASWVHTPAAGGTADMSTDHIENCVKLTTPATAGLNGYSTAPTASAVNLSAYDYIELNFWTDTHEVSSPNLGTLFLFTSTPGTADYYSAVISSRKPGWNTVRIEKALFTATGTPSWSNINQVRFRLNSTASYARACYFADLNAAKIKQRQPVISFTFDDGWDDGLQIAALAAARGIKASFFIIRHLLDTAGYLKTTDLVKIAAMGHEIGIHGADAGYNNWQEEYNTIGYEGLVSNLKANRDFLRLLGVDSEIASWPQGYYYLTSPIMDITSDPILKAVQESGIVYARTTAQAHTTAGDFGQFNEKYPKSGLMLPSGMSLNSSNSLAAVKAEIDLTRDKGGWLIPYGHKIGDTADSVTWTASDLISLFDYAIAEREAGRIAIKSFGETAKTLASYGYLTYTSEK
jgi:hypothetical protein